MEKIQWKIENIIHMICVHRKDSDAEVYFKKMGEAYAVRIWEALKNNS